MPELQQQDVGQSNMTPSIASRSTPNIASQYGQATGRRPQRATSAKYYNIATSILSNDIDDLFLAAARDGEYEKIEHILQRRSDVVVSIDVKDKRTGNTPLMWAAKKGHSKIVQILLKHGADPTLHNYEDLSALEMATNNIKTILLDSVEKTTESTHRLLLQAAWQGNIKIVRRLLSQNIVKDVNCQNAEGLTPLLLVARDIQLFERLSVQLNRHYNPIEVAIELLNNRADIHMADIDGKTSLHYACLSRATIAKELVENLITSGSELEFRDKRSFTPIHLASQSGNQYIINALLHGGSEVNSRGFLGLTPLHITSQQDHQRAAMILLDNGADVTIIDDQGKSPVDLAKSKKMKSTLKEAWTEATQKKISPTLAPVRAPSRDESKQTPTSKRRKGEVIFDGLVSSPVSNLRPTSKSINTADKARRAEEQMMKDIENGTFTHMPNVKEGMKRLTAMRSIKSTLLPKVSSSCQSTYPDRTSPESPRQRAGHGDGLRRSLEDGRNLINSPRTPVTALPARHSTSSSIEDLELCVQNNRVSPSTERKKIKTHHRVGSDPFSSPACSDLTVSYDNILTHRHGRTKSDSTLNMEDYDDSSPTRLPHTPLDRELTVLNIPTTIPESLSPGSTENTTVMYLDMNRQEPNRKAVANPTFVAQRSYSFREAKLVDTEREGLSSKDSSPRSDEEIILSRSGSLRLIYSNPAELLRSRSLLKEEFVLEESRPRDSMILSSGSDPLSSATSSLSTSPRDAHHKIGLSASSKLPGVDVRVNGISSGGKSSIKRSRSFSQGQKFGRLTNQIQDPSHIRHLSNEKLNAEENLNEKGNLNSSRRSFRKDKVLKPLDTNTKSGNVSDSKNDQSNSSSCAQNPKTVNSEKEIPQSVSKLDVVITKPQSVPGDSGIKDIAKKGDENSNKFDKTSDKGTSDKTNNDPQKIKPTSKDFKVSFCSPSPDKNRDVTSAKSRSMSAKSRAMSAKSVSSSVVSVSKPSSTTQNVRASVPTTKPENSVPVQTIDNKTNESNRKNIPSAFVEDNSFVLNEKNDVGNLNESVNTIVTKSDNSCAKSNVNSSKTTSTVSKTAANSNSKPLTKFQKEPTTKLQTQKPKVSIPSTSRTAPKKVTSGTSLKVMSLGIKSTTSSVTKATTSESPIPAQNKNKPPLTNTCRTSTPQVNSPNLTNIENVKPAPINTSPISTGSGKSACSEKYRVASAKAQLNIPTPKPSTLLPKSSSQTQISSSKSSAFQSKSGAVPNSARSCGMSGIQVSVMDDGTPTPGRNLKSAAESKLVIDSTNDPKQPKCDKQHSKTRKKSTGRKISFEPKEPLVRISVPGEEPKVNLSQQNMDEFLAEMHTPIIVNPFEDLVMCQNQEAELPNGNKPNYTITKTTKDATVKLKNASKTRIIKSARKPKPPTSATSRQTSAGKKKGGKVKSVKTASEDVRPKSGKAPKSAKSKTGKKTKKGQTLAEHAAKPDVALISGIGWQLATGCLDNSDVKVAQYIGSDSDGSLIYDDPGHDSDIDLLLSPRNSPGPEFRDQSPDFFQPMQFDRIQEFQQENEWNTDFNSEAYNEITARLHREILKNKMTPIPESTGSSLVFTTTKPIYSHDNIVTIETVNKSANPLISKQPKPEGQGHHKGKNTESQINSQKMKIGYHDNNHSVSPADENIDQVIDEILNFNTSSLNSTLRSHKSMRSANSTLTEVDVKLLQELRKPVSGFHAQKASLDDSDDAESIEEEEITPKIKVTKETDSSKSRNDITDEEAKEIAKVVRTFGHLELHAGGSIRSVGKKSPRKDVSASFRNYASLNSSASTNRKPPSGRFQELKLPDQSEARKDPSHSSFKKSPEDVVLEQFQEVVGVDSIVQSLADVIKDGDLDTSQTIDRFSNRRGSGSSSACTSESMSSTTDLTSQWKKGNILGKGAFGTVWCGLTNEGGLIAVKQIELNSMDIEKTHREYEKVQEEVELLKNLNHKNIVGYLGTSFEDGIVNIFMQFIPGGSLASILARFGALEESVFRRYTRQILEGVEYLHDNEVIHRDIKGGNVMLMQNGIIKLIDFGCAKRLCFNLSMSQSQILKSMKGTPYWMAPEVVSETGHGKKSDIWSIGCTVFEMATRKPPWSEMNPMAAIFAIGSDRPVPQLSENFSVTARQFVNACLTRDQSTRLSATELLSHPFIVKKPQSRK